MDTLITVLGISYTGAALTMAGFLALIFGPKVLRWIVRNPPETLEDWLLLPLVGFFALFGGMLGLWAASLLWPVTTVALFRDARRKRLELHEAEAEEFESLLVEVREHRKAPSS